MTVQELFTGTLETTFGVARRCTLSFAQPPPLFFFPSTLYMIDRHSPVSLNTPYASSSYLCKNQIRKQLYHFHHPVCFYRQLNQARHHVINQNHWRRYPHLWQHLQRGMSLRWYIKDLHWRRFGMFNHHRRYHRRFLHHIPEGIPIQRSMSHLQPLRAQRIN